MVYLFHVFVFHGFFVLFFLIFFEFGFVGFFISIGTLLGNFCFICLRLLRCILQSLVIRVFVQVLVNAGSALGYRLICRFRVCNGNRSKQQCSRNMAKLNHIILSFVNDNQRLAKSLLCCQ